ncbi:uncharacterized protein B0T15DRAFT_389181, partial [Chaetomium strumarium]
LLPETARSILGDGSAAVNPINKAPIPILSPKASQEGGGRPDAVPREDHRKFPNPLAALRLLRIPGTAIILVAYDINYTVYCCLQASLATLFVDTYQVSGLTARLIYLPFGVAVALSAFATGRLLDVNYSKTAAELGISVKIDEGTKLKDFPIYSARCLQLYPLRSGAACLEALDTILRRLGPGWSFLLFGVLLVLLFLCYFCCSSER